MTTCWSYLLHVLVPGVIQLCDHDVVGVGLVHGEAEHDHHRRHHHAALPHLSVPVQVDVEVLTSVVSTQLPNIDSVRGSIHWSDRDHVSITTSLRLSHHVSVHHVLSPLIVHSQLTSISLTNDLIASENNI